MVNRYATGLCCLCAPMYWLTKSLLSWVKVETVAGLILLNHVHAEPFNVTGKALHIISSSTACRCISVTPSPN